jgi:NAD(P)-dependent dehydrogenase (short-subunit alcohol dehydrogenase family)
LSVITSYAAAFIASLGGNQRIDFRELSAADFEAFWRVGCFGGFLVGRAAARRLAPLGHRKIVGASASLGGEPGFAHFACAIGRPR